MRQLSGERPESGSSTSIPVIQIVRQYSLHYGDFSPAVTIPPTDNGEQPLRIVLLDGNQSHSSMVRNALGEAGEPTQMHSDPD